MSRNTTQAQEGSVMSCVMYSSFVTNDVMRRVTEWGKREMVAVSIVWSPTEDHRTRKSHPNKVHSRHIAKAGLA